MLKPCSMLLALGLASTASAQLAISIGIRETAAGGGSFTSIGADGGSLGGIEWVNRDAQTLVLDGTWQQFTFNIATDPLTGFAGTTANSVLDGAFGVLEHIRILNTGGVTGPITLWIDDVSNTITPGGGSPQTTNFGDFEGHPTGTEVMFQEPSFSGSTATNINAGSTTGVDNLVASRSSSLKVEFQFVDGTATRWVRLTTFNTGILPNPLIRFDDQSVVTFWMRGGKCQPDLGSQGPGSAIAEFCGDGLGSGQQSTYYTAGAPAGAAGALAISLAGQPDVPLLGGNLVSFSGFLFSVGINADANGRFNVTLPGDPNMFDLVWQTVYLDPGVPFNLAFTNAVRAEFGR